MVNFLFNEIVVNENKNTLAEMASKSCLDGKSENEFNENNVAANDLNSLASVNTQEIHTDNAAGNLCHAGIIIIQQHLCHFIITFQSLCAKAQDFMDSHLLIYRAVGHSFPLFTLDLE